MNKEADKEFLEFVLRAIVDHPEDVRVERKVDEKGVLLSVRVNPLDMGQVIGRNGDTANKALRPLLRIVSIKNNNSRNVYLKIEEPEGGARPQRPSLGDRPMDNNAGG